MFKLVRTLLAVIVGAVLIFTALTATAAYFLGEEALKFVLARAVTDLTGFRTEIGELHYRFPESFKAEKVKLYNPEGFENPLFASAPTLKFTLNLKAAGQGEKIHFYELELHLSQINIEKKTDGVSNYSLLKTVGGKLKKNARQAADGGSFPFWIDRLELEIDSVSYHDRTGVLPKKIMDIRYKKKVIVNIRNGGALIQAIANEVKQRAKKEKWGSMTPFYVERSLSKAASKGGDILKEASEVVTEGGKTVMEGGKVVVEKTAVEGPVIVTQKAGEVVKNTAQGVKQMTEATKEQLEELGGFLGIGNDENDEKSLPEHSQKNRESGTLPLASSGSSQKIPEELKS